MRKNVFFLMFMLSGFCGLAYQIVWLRLALASFGVITPVLSVVVSVFMLGICGGSIWGGPLARSLKNRFGISALTLYALAEILIGIGGALLVPTLFKLSESWLLGLGEMDSAKFLIASALGLSLSLLPWCILMGMTFPLVLAYFQEKGETFKNGFSFLYLANLIGALIGVVCTVLFLIEILGFRGTLVVAASFNLSIALIALYLKNSIITHGSSQSPSIVAKVSSVSKAPAAGSPSSQLLIPWLFLSGFSSMALEVAWTRGFTPILKTQVYSFATLLFFYLLATSLGSALYRRHVAAGKVINLDRLMIYLGIASMLQIFLNDFRVHKDPGGIFLAILPFCGLLGYVTPRLIDDFSQGDAERVGKAYAWNALGCVVGPLVASYIFLPSVGVRLTMFVLSLPFLVYAASSLFRISASRRFRWTSGITLLACAGMSSFWARSYEEPHPGILVERDNSATVIAAGQGMDRQLLVNGVGITVLTPLTKMMAHFPLASLEKAPKSAVVICFGMGTTWRSLMSWGINATAVELSAAVFRVFPFYHADAADLIANKNGQRVVDDGRRYLKRSRETYDVITLDPPPPVEAAGSSLLYTEEFYTTVKERLSEDGILQQWFPGGEAAISGAVAHSLVNSFPYVRSFGGNYYLASLKPLPKWTSAELAARMPESAKKDLLEWADSGSTVEMEFDKILNTEVDPKSHFGGDESSPKITDNRPYNEYYWLRRLKLKLGL